MAPSPKHKMSDRLHGTDKNVWVEFTGLVVEHNALNLGQGFPDYSCPQYVKDALCQATNGPNPLLNQYTRSFGHLRLVRALAQVYNKLLDRELDPMKEVLVTCGAYESLYCSVMGLINPGDEAIIIEPFFDCYEPMVKVAGGTAKFVPLKPVKKDGEITSADWKLDPNELEALFTPKTKALFFNNPNNPLGKVYSMKEMTMIADLCKKYDVIVISDEVYEWMVYPGSKMIRMATLPGMWDRTITIGSAGKTFSVTGWKLGWSIAPRHLMHALQTCHQNVVYTGQTPLQEAVAVGFELEYARMDSPESYFNSLALELLPKRDKMVELLTNVGMVPTIPEGGYFIIADYSKLNIQVKNDSGDPKDYDFVRWLIKEKKLGSIPPSAFYSVPHRNLSENYVRFCFFKKDETLEKAGEIMNAWKASM